MGTIFQFYVFDISHILEKITSKLFCNCHFSRLCTNGHICGIIRQIKIKTQFALQLLAQLMVYTLYKNVSINKDCHLFPCILYSCTFLRQAGDERTTADGLSTCPRRHVECNMPPGKVLQHFHIILRTSCVKNVNSVQVLCSYRHDYILGFKGLITSC